MAKVKVYIEETLCKCIEVEVSDDIVDKDEQLDVAKYDVIKRYKNGDIVLTSDDFNGSVQVMAEHEDGIYNTSWHNLR